MIRVRRLSAAMLVVAIAGCDHTAAPPGLVGSGSKLYFVISNQLLAPVSIAIDDTAALIVQNGQSAPLTVSSTAQWLTWTSAKATDFSGTPIPDDIGKVRLPVFGIRDTLLITNIIADTTYFTGQFFNLTPAQVVLGVSNGSAVSCASVLPAAIGQAQGFTKIGYYRLLATTEVRAYRAGSGCTGPFVAFPPILSAAVTPRTGLVSLTLSSAP